MTREDWLAYRHTGIGASEVGIIMGLDDYMSSLELFHYKTGAAYKFDVESMSQFMGREHEDMIAQLWQYWEHDEDGMIKNFREGKIVRKCQRVNAYVRNPAYPWLFVSLDRKINKYGDKGEGTLELKTIGGYEADKWAAGIPPKWVAQVQTQMLVPEFDWGELALLQDGRHMSVLPFDKSEKIQEHVIIRTKDFWDRVVKGRMLVNEIYEARINFNNKRVNDLTAEFDNLAPEPDGSLAYANYVSDKYNKPRYPDRAGSPAELEMAIKHKEVANQVKLITEEKTKLENYLKYSMKDFQVLDFGLEGKVYWSINAAGNRTFRNKVKGEE